MDYLQDILNSIGIQIGLFLTGLFIGSGVFVSEMTLFVGNIIMVALSNSLPASDVGNSIISHYYLMMSILPIAGFIQGILLGLLDKASFSFGYISGIFLMVLFLGGALWNVFTGVVIGMIFALISTVIGLCLKIFKNKREHDYRYYQW